MSIFVEKWNESNLVLKDIGLDLKRAEVVCGLHAFSERRHLQPSPLQLLVVQILIDYTVGSSGRYMPWRRGAHCQSAWSSTEQYKESPHTMTLGNWNDPAHIAKPLAAQVIHS